MTGVPGASGSAKAQVARLLTLVPYLQARGEVRLGDAADALGVPADQVLRDLKVLFMCGLPGGYPDDLIDVDLDGLEDPDEPETGARADGVIRVSNADYLARPLRLTPTEASAVTVALRALRSGARDDTREVVDRVLAKLEAAAAEGTPAPRVDPGSDPGHDTDVALLAARLRRAAAQQRQVRIQYYVPARDEQTDRVVDPRGVVGADSHLYLDGWCHTAEAPRLFRLDRIQAAEILDTAVSTPPEPPRDLGDGIFAQSTDATTVTLLLEAEARWVVDYYSVQDVRERPDGSWEVDLLIADRRFLTRLAMQLAPYARVLAPTEYADDCERAARATLGLYAVPDRGTDVG